MDDMSPQQQQQQQQQRDSLDRGGGQPLTKLSQSYRRQSATPLVISKALTRSKTLSRESFLPPVSPDACPLVQSFLINSDRSFLLHAHVQLKTGMQTQDRHLFLFTDILVTAKAKSANHFKQKARVRVCEMWTASCMDEVCEGSTNPERSFVIGWPTCNYVATFRSTEQKEKWLSLLKRGIKEEREAEEPKTIPLKVYGKGINTFAVDKTLPVSNWDSTNEVIRLALQQFGIIGNLKDFQLWVISKRDNVPYPLIGHEFPFSIQMNHVRHTALQRRDARAPPADRGVARHGEKLQVRKQCQFILRPRPTETPTASEALYQKTLKRRHSFIGWAFWRSSAPHLNEVPLSVARGCLFGLPLGAVCVEGALPKPVMDMLVLLYNEGLWIEWILRRPGKALEVRKLRDYLDSGEVQLPSTIDIYVIASVFKEFLRCIPGSLLCCELHQEWMDVLEDEDEEEEEQVQDIKRMIGRLPKENALLLRYVLAVLHTIQGNAQENKMTSCNLSVCISPSMLWRPGPPLSPELERERPEKPLVEFMIDHCEQILEQHPSSLFGGPPQRPTEMKSDAWLYPQTDSSYDSLENELDNSRGSPGFISIRQFGPKIHGGSLDSVLTFSDTEQLADSPHGFKSRTLMRRRQNPELSYTDQEAETADITSKLDSLSLDVKQMRRRSSEPVFTYAGMFGETGSADGLSGEEDGGTQAPGSSEGRDQPTFTLGASSSSLSSTPTSPELAYSSQHFWVRRQGLHVAKTHQKPDTSPIPPKQLTTGSATTSSGHPGTGTCPKGSPPREPLNWGALKSCRSLHPNLWLRKGRRLSLTQQDNSEKEKSREGPSQKTVTLGKHVPATGKAAEEEEGKLISSPQPGPESSCRTSEDAGEGRSPKSQHLKEAPASPPPNHCSIDSLHLQTPPCFNLSNSRGDTNQSTARSDVKVLKKRSPSLFYKQSGLTLSLFKPNKPEEAHHNARLYQRRGSEPGHQLIERASNLTRARLRSDPGLKVTRVDSQQGLKMETYFCLSPGTTKAVRDYFGSHPYSNPQSSQQVAHALMESRREWLKRCNNPSTEADLDQLLLSEESFV